MHRARQALTGIYFQ